MRLGPRDLSFTFTLRTLCRAAAWTTVRRRQSLEVCWCKVAMRLAAMFHGGESGKGMPRSWVRRAKTTASKLLPLTNVLALHSLLHRPHCFQTCHVSFQVPGNMLTSMAPTFYGQPHILLDSQRLGAPLIAGCGSSFSHKSVGR